MALAQEDPRRADAAARLAYAYLASIARGDRVAARGFAELLKSFWNANLGAIRQYAQAQGATLTYPPPYISQASWSDDNFVTAVIDALGIYGRQNGVYTGVMTALGETPANESEIPRWFGQVQTALRSTDIGNWADAIARSRLSRAQLLSAIDSYVESGELRLIRVEVGGGEIEPPDPRRRRAPLANWAWIAIGLGVVGALGVLGYGFYRKGWGRKLLGRGAHR